MQLSSGIITSEIRYQGMPLSKIPRVAVLVDTATGWGRRLVRGIGRYARKHGPWHIWIDARDQRAMIKLPPKWQGEGIIARIQNHAMARHVAAAGVPTVNVSAVKLKGVEGPQVITDLQASARMAAEHLLDRGFRNFAYCGLERWSYTEYHKQGFVKALREAGCECLVYKARQKEGFLTPWHVQQQGLIRWLKPLPKPVGILAWTTNCGREVINACRKAGLLVPEQVAVLASDEDELLCELCNPPLSGIALTSERIGYEAAATLDRLMQGRRPTENPILIEPTGVIARQSTDTLAIDDDDMARAIAFIRSHATKPIQVSDVLREIAMSRSRLERRFQETLGRTPAAEIRRSHIDRAKNLLAETDLSIPDVAEASGFGSREYLAYAFKSETGLTPREYRSRIRVR